MELDKLVMEIVRRVLEKLEALEKEGVDCSHEAVETESPKCEIKITKRVITEKDIVLARNSGGVVIFVKRKAILTDLAKEYAHVHGLEIRCTLEEI